jgi:hypothetical protein
MNTISYDKCLATYLKMDTRKFFGNWVCRAHNKKILDPVQYSAMEAAFPNMKERADKEYAEETRKQREKIAEMKKIREENMKRIRDAEDEGDVEVNDDEDPRVRAGTHERVFSRQKCGGKGQTQLVCEIVPIDD